MEAPLGYPHLADPFGLLDPSDEEADAGEDEEEEGEDEEEEGEDQASEEDDADAAAENEKASAAFEAMLAICRPELSSVGATPSE